MDRLAKSEADAAWGLDKGGFLLTKSGAADRFDSTTLGGLAAGAFAATQGVANLIGETDFNCVYQQGENFSMIVSNVDEQALLVVVFKARVSAGAVKYYAANAPHPHRRATAHRPRAYRFARAGDRLVC